MNAMDLLGELKSRGVHLEVSEDRHRFSPRPIVSVNLLARMKEHKADLISILRQPDGKPGVHFGFKRDDWETPLASFDDSNLELDVCANWDSVVVDVDCAEQEWNKCITPPEACPQCGTLELWESLARNWHCVKCKPPTTAKRLRDFVVRKKQTKNRS